MTFDFGPEVLPKFIAALPPEIQEPVRDQLNASHTGSLSNRMRAP